MSRKNSKPKAEIPSYALEGFRPLHRMENEHTDFGCNKLDKQWMIPGFEMYSSVGVKSSMGPLKSAFYRISITISGTVDVQLGLEHFNLQPGSLCFTTLNQVFSKKNISDDLFGYYILFTGSFLEELVQERTLTEVFPFFDYTGVPFFSMNAEEMRKVEQFVLQMNEELQSRKTGREKAIRLYLYLLLLEAKRSYERQQLAVATNIRDNNYLTTRYLKLVSQHFLTNRKVAEYAGMLAITANHLNKVIKETTGNTASDAITEMLLREAKAVLRYTDAPVSEIAFQLNFSEPAAFSRFFKKAAGITPQDFREKA
ncbi:AraC-type DNA-binding protein [Filimonas lacunae]|uniref:AraC-type DNA-binding protein n=1 Tax=Filimonas lacunae TaxID=477680 RepID=A0A173MIS2_9BACT|nr:AraC family transcriptional regulator [Filimonas lacunae]BAV07399.1 transcriptional regulator, AraC family [Filimonas lacunae]SIT30505.1 AraC-type DNA-binding protein [Filimonas lacunae]